ncbi:MAG TPA: alanine--tRNA ligase [Candidatus Nanoarchaeia archaeon]|nr:alanine--tRNA ligase [Candidatus Nanoarchaeia archaeon]
MNADELRKKYFTFFRGKNHALIPSSSLVPEHDPTVLFTTAGMQPLVPYLTGQKHPLGRRLVNVQKCIRTGDIDEVGDNFHLTFFEMLGNWSLGDYFKQEAISWSWEFLRGKEWLGLPKEKIAVSVFKGDKDAPFDKESYEIWRSLGVPEERIAKLGKEDNWWGPVGEAGPCGPDTEMFFWTGSGKAPLKFDPRDKRWAEIWNDVFMEYEKKKDGSVVPLAQRNVDTGMGVERVVTSLNGKQSVFETELFIPLIDNLKLLSGIADPDEFQERSFRIIADHLRAAVFILGDERGVVPSNVDQGYILRRFIRRAVRHGNLLGISRGFTKEAGALVVDMFSNTYPELKKKKQSILNELMKEERQFRQTLEKGLRQFGRFVKDKKELISGREAFLLFQSYGFPIEMTVELAKEKGLKVDENGFSEDFEKHKDLSRRGAEQKFKGGLADTSANTVKLHTATHLLNEALRMVVDEGIVQKGSNITPERLRFDFNLGRKLTKDEIKKVEELVNRKIQEAIPVERKEMPFEKAKKLGCQMQFGESYGDRVSVYFIGDFSKEFCGGPHVTNTSELGSFKIVSEEGIGKGVRRIKATVR